MTRAQAKLDHTQKKIRETNNPCDHRHNKIRATYNNSIIKELHFSYCTEDYFNRLYKNVLHL